MRSSRLILFTLAIWTAMPGLYAQGRDGNLQDLVGARSRDGEKEMRRRGYRLARVDKSRHDNYQYYSRRRECVEVEIDNGRYRSIRGTSMSDCDERRGDRDAVRVDYPRVRVDTAGRGDYSAPGFNSARIDRGYVDTGSDRVMVGLGGKDDFRVLFYGTVTRRVGDREYEIDINDSSEGPASGRGRFRFNPDRNEVEMIDIQGRMGRGQFTGRFNRK